VVQRGIIAAGCSIRLHAARKAAANKAGQRIGRAA
jgi:hypothetical protein